MALTAVIFLVSLAGGYLAVTRTAVRRRAIVNHLTSIHDDFGPGRRIPGGLGEVLLWFVPLGGLNVCGA